MQGDWCSMWRPVSEKPREGIPVLLAFEVVSGCYFYDVGRWYTEDGADVWCDDTTETEYDEPPRYWSFIHRPRFSENAGRGG